LLFPENLKHFRRGGRVSNISGFFGDALSVRPLMCVNRQGELQIIKKVRGKQKIIRELAKMIEQNISKFTKTIYLAVADNERLKLDLVEEIRSRIPDIIIECYDINPTTGAHCGPDTIGVGFMGKDSNLIL
jgi:DegV family protein with EDD domain